MLNAHSQIMVNTNGAAGTSSVASLSHCILHIPYVAELSPHKYTDLSFHTLWCDLLEAVSIIIILTASSIIRKCGSTSYVGFGPKCG